MGSLTHGKGTTAMSQVFVWVVLSRVSKPKPVDMQSACQPASKRQSAFQRLAFHCKYQFR